MNSPERQQYSLILLGEFNPAMFQPEWNQSGLKKII